MPTEAEKKRAVEQAKLVITAMLQKAARTVLDPEHLEGTRQDIDELWQAAAELERESEFIRKSRREPYVTEDVKALTQRWGQQKLSPIEERVKSKEKRIETLKEALKPKPVTLDPLPALLRELQLQERRRLLREVTDQFERQRIYQEGDSLMQDAVETAPDFRPLVGKEIIEKVQWERAVRGNPEAAAELETLLSIVPIIRSALDSVRSSAGLEGDPIEAIARGEV
jgi:hypothetical protein